MKIIIQTYRFQEGGAYRLVKEKQCGNVVEGLREWMNAQLDFSIDRIRVLVDKRPVR
jgi:hypothetical protein